MQKEGAVIHVETQFLKKILAYVWATTTLAPAATTNSLSSYPQVSQFRTQQKLRELFIVLWQLYADAL